MFLGVAFLILSAIPVVITVIAGIVLVVKHQIPRYDMYDVRSVIVKMADIRTMKKCIRTGDMDGLDNLLNKHPELICYQSSNHETLLEYARTVSPKEKAQK